MNNNFFLLALVLSVIVLTVGCTQAPPAPPSEPMISLQLIVIDQNGTELFNQSRQVAPNSNALAVMQEMVAVELEEFSFGKFVTSIAGKKADSMHYWAVYQNSAYAQIGIEQIVISEPTVLEWKLTPL